VARKPVAVVRPAGTRPPRTARHSRQTDCQPAPRVVVPADKRKQQQQSGFRRPATPFRWPYQSCLMLFGMPRGWGQSRQSPRRFWHCRIRAFTARFLGGQELWHLWGEHRPVVPMSGSEHGKCDIARPAILPRRPWAGTGRCRLPTCEYQVRAGAMSASGRKQTSALRWRLVRCYSPLSTQSGHPPERMLWTCSARLFIGLLAGAGALYDQAASGGESNIRCAVDKSYNRTQGSGY